MGIDAGLRPLPDEGIVVESLPFWYHLNKPDWQGGAYFLQGGANTWRAEWLDGSARAMTGASVYWGDNLTHHTCNTHAVTGAMRCLTSRDGIAESAYPPSRHGTPDVGDT